MNKPFFALGAPHTTLTVSLLPMSTSQTLNLSALGCCCAFSIFATIKSSNSEGAFSKLSTSRPTFVKLLIISLSLRSVSKCCLSQSIVNFIYSILCSLMVHLKDRTQNGLAIYNLFQKKLLNH